MKMRPAEIKPNKNIYFTVDYNTKILSLRLWIVYLFETRKIYFQKTINQIAQKEVIVNRKVKDIAT